MKRALSQLKSICRKTWGLFVPLLFFPISSYAFASVSDMTLEEKVGQLLMVHFDGEEVTEDAKSLVQEIKAGGIIYYSWSNTLSSPEQVSRLSRGLQALTQDTRCKIPLLIAADQEGGLVSRLKDGFTKFPGNQALAKTGNRNYTTKASFIMGQEMLGVGVNLNLAPVVDIDSNPSNPVIGIRSFGKAPGIVTAFGASAIKGYKKAGVLTCLKHFPGHGDVEADSHDGLPTLHKSQEELLNFELVPFIELKSLADAVMTAHLLVPSLDPDNCTTLSSKSLNFLRDRIGFTGVIISDSLVMEGALKGSTSLDSVAIKALNAGCDILLLGGRKLNGPKTINEPTVADIRRVHASLVQAVKCGEIPLEKLDQAVGRVLELKKKIKPGPLRPLPDFIATEQNLAFAQKVTKESIETLYYRPLPATAKEDVTIIVPKTFAESIQDSYGKGCLKEGAFHTYASNPSEDEIALICNRLPASGTYVLYLYKIGQNKGQTALYQAVLSQNKSVIVVCLSDPLDHAFFREAALLVCTYSPAKISLKEASKIVLPFLKIQKRSS